MRNIYLILLSFSLFSCSNESTSTIEVQGHRGARAYYPENSIQGFIAALEMGVHTLEMDVVITKDHKILVSHEAFLNHEICQNHAGERVSNEKSWNIYQMTLDSVQQFDCGSINHPRFPNQEHFPSFKPTLEEVVNAVKSSVAKNHLQMPHFNIETKSTMEGDSIYHPAPKEFMSLVLNEIRRLEIDSLTIIQSFDVRTLQELKEMDPNITTCLLVENEEGIKSNIEKLGFTPHIYSPDFNLINEEVIKVCKEKEIRLIPWTVNKTNDIKKVIEQGVDGIISDNPDSVFMVIQNEL